MIEAPEHRACRERTHAEGLGADEAAIRRLPEDVLHARCAHPDWQYTYTEGPRKQWDYSDEPPEGEGWIRNRHRGDRGWERFEYTEESYWMRPRRKADHE